VPALLAKRGLAARGQGCHIGPGGADAERERLPPVIEAGVADADRQRGGLRAAQPGLREEAGQVTFADAGEVRLAGGGSEYCPMNRM
jgi:hypothetical protein